MIPYGAAVQEFSSMFCNVIAQGLHRWMALCIVVQTDKTDESIQCCMKLSPFPKTATGSLAN